MSRKRDLRDTAILVAITGSEDISNLPMQIESDYLLREKRENLREMGFSDPMFELSERSDLEKAIFKADKQLEKLEGERVNREYEDEYPGMDPDERLINWMIENPVHRTVVVV